MRQIDRLRSRRRTSTTRRKPGAPTGSPSSPSPPPRTCSSTAGAPDGDLGYEPGRKGVIIATGIGGLETLEEQILVHDKKGPRRVSPFLVPMMMPNAGGARSR